MTCENCVALRARLAAAGAASHLRKITKGMIARGAEELFAIAQEQGTAMRSDWPASKAEDYRSAERILSAALRAEQPAPKEG
jgi:hypothetical protein